MKSVTHKGRPAGAEVPVDQISRPHGVGIGPGREHFALATLSAAPRSVKPRLLTAAHMRDRLLAQRRILLDDSAFIPGDLPPIRTAQSRCARSSCWLAPRARDRTPPDKGGRTAPLPCRPSPELERLRVVERAEEGRESRVRAAGAATAHVKLPTDSRERLAWHQQPHAAAIASDKAGPPRQSSELTQPGCDTPA